MSDSFVTPLPPWTVAHQAPLCMEFSRQEYLSGLPFPSPGDLPYPVSNPRLLSLRNRQGDSLPPSHLGSPCWRWVSEGVKSLNCVRLCNPMDCRLPGSSLHGILQARILEWVAISFSRGSSWLRDRTRVSELQVRCFNLGAMLTLI